MVHDRRSTGVLLGEVQHGQFHLAKYLARNKPMEFAIAMGTEPVTPIIAGCRIPPGVSEADVIGGIRGEPLELVKCETVDLMVPAESEIVFEGKIHPNDLKDEGPFGEYTGYMAGDRDARPVCRISAVTHRTDPILPVTCMGVPVDDSAAQRPIFIAGLLDDLRQRGFPIKMIYSTPEVSHHFMAVSTKVPYPNYVEDLAAAIFSSQGYRGIYQLFIVDEDINVTDLNEVMWAFSTRCHPGRGISIQKCVGHPLIPFISVEEKHLLRAARAYFDCTWPKEWPPEQVPIKASLDVMWPKEMQDHVISNWEKTYKFPSSK
jgi:4-hydroxy-3-polyprenylbenzoate decarboxylase